MSMEENTTVPTRGNSNWIFLLVAAIVLAGSFIYIGREFIQSNKENQQTSQWITNTISVIGEGKSKVTPDTLTINLSVSEVALTTKEAQTQANEKIAKIQAILEKAGVSKDNIKTQNLNVYPEYNRSNNTQTISGYRSQQTLTIELNGEKYVDQWNSIIDEISALGNVNIDNTSFEIKDKIKGLAEARQKAFDDAKAKAEQLATMWGVTLGKPVMITDNGISYSPGPIYYAKAEMAMGARDMAVASPSLSAGQSEVNLTITVVYEIK